MREGTKELGKGSHEIFTFHIGRHESGLVREQSFIIGIADEMKMCFLDGVGWEGS